MNNNEEAGALDMADIERHNAEYVEEVRRKYPKDLVQESERKTATYTKSDWVRIQAESNDLYRRLAAHMDQGPAAPEVQKTIAEFRQHISDYFYECPVEVFRGLGDLYVNDPRFTANIDKHAPGLARFMREAMIRYAAHETGETRQEP